MLDKIVLNHEKWLKVALSICKCKDAANDLVQDMYIKMHQVNKEVDDGYIYFVLRSIFIESKRKKKEFTKETKEIEFLLKPEEEENDTFLLQKKSYQNAYKSLEKFEKVIIHFSSKMGLREFSRKSGISISLVQKTKRKLKKLIWEESKKYAELEMLSAKLQKQLESKSATVAKVEKM
jgi:hypothetical protein